MERGSTDQHSLEVIKMKKLIVFMLILLVAGIANSAPPTRPHSYATGLLIDPDENNLNENTLYNYLANGVDTYVDGSIVNADIDSAAGIAVTKIAGTAVNLTATQTITGNKTFTGTSVLGTTTLGATTADSLILGTPNQGDIWYDNGTSMTRLTPGTAGYFLKTEGAAANPVWAKVGTYYEPDSTCILAFDNGSTGFDLSNLRHVPTLTSLTEAQLFNGKVSPKCYHFDGANDYVTIPYFALLEGMSAITIESWFYWDNAGIDAIVCIDHGDRDIMLYITNTNDYVRLKTSVGIENLDRAHNLAADGEGAWYYVVFVWDSSAASTCYVNGASIGNGNGTGTGTITNNGSSSNLQIGMLDDTTGKWDGKIDGLRILRRRMSAAEVLARYNSFK